MVDRSSLDVVSRRKLRQNRVSLACVNCRRLKKKCDGLKPSCGNCVLQRVQCKWVGMSVIKLYPSQQTDPNVEVQQASQRLETPPTSSVWSTGWEPEAITEIQQSQAGAPQKADSPASQYQKITTEPDETMEDVQSHAISNHTPESSARGTAELQESDTLQPPDRPEAGGIDERRESDAGHSESTLGVDSAEGATDCGREQPQEHPQTGPRRASHDECQAQSNGRSPAPSGISHPRKNILPARKLQVELSDEPGPAYNVHERPRSEFRESTQPRRVEQYAREPTQPQPSHGSFQTFNTNPTVEHQSQPKRYPRLQGERQHQIQPQTSYYSSQYKASARSQDQHQALTQSRQQAPTSHPVPHPQARNKSRMIKGHTYDQSDPELVYDRARCHYLLSQFNSSSSASAGHRRLLAKSLLGGVGEGVEIEVPFRCEYGYNIKVGEGTYIGADCIIEDPSIVFIGSKCVIGPRVSICCKKSSPNLNDHDGSRSLFYAPGIWIEDRVCIEAGVIIHAGVRIGTGSTIVAGSVVTKSIRERSLAGGNPATTFQYI